MLVLVDRCELESTLRSFKFAWYAEEVPDKDIIMVMDCDHMVRCWICPTFSLDY